MITHQHNRRYRRGKLASFIQRCLVCCALAGVIVSSTGMWFAPPRTVGNGERFPCETHGCGCASARECWNHCCCFSDQQRLAWALEHNVAPPSELVRQVARARDESAATLAPASRGCCSSGGIDASECSIADVATVDVAAAGDPSPPLVTLEQFGRCHGLAAYKAVFAAATFETPDGCWTHALSPTGWLRHRSLQADTLTPAPPTPPPRVLS